MGKDSSVWRRDGFCMEVESEDDLNSFFDKTDQGENEDGIWKFTFTIKRQVKSNADVVDDDGVVQSGRCFIFAYYIL